VVDLEASAVVGSMVRRLLVGGPASSSEEACRVVEERFGDAAFVPASSAWAQAVHSEQAHAASCLDREGGNLFALYHRGFGKTAVCPIFGGFGERSGSAEQESGFEVQMVNSVLTTKQDLALVVVPCREVDLFLGPDGIFFGSVEQRLHDRVRTRLCADTFQVSVHQSSALMMHQ
jgi:hypothetical protein